MRLTSIFSAAAAMAVLCCCSPEKAKDPALEALETRIGELVGEEAEISVFLFEKVDSTTFAEELSHRKDAFEYKLKQDEKFLLTYVSKRQNARIEEKTKSIRNDYRIMEGLDSIAVRIAPYEDDIAYYDYHFSGKAVSASGITEFKDYYACITPSNVVLCIEPTSKGLHKTLGRVLPGYSDLFVNPEE